jgi:plasmid replication initiation protein
MKNITKYQKDELSGDREVVKNNKLINAHYKLSIGEQKLVLTLCSKIKSDDITFKEYKLDAKEFFELLGLKSLENHTHLQNVCKKLSSRVFNIESDDGFRIFPWLHHVQYKKGDGKILIQFHEELAPYLLFVKNNIYTKYKLGNVLQFKSEYSIRIYELMKQIYPRIKQRTMTIEELRNTLGIEKNEYTKYSNFKRVVLETAKKEINSKSDIEIEITEIKKARKVVSLVFSVAENFSFSMPIDGYYDYLKYKAKSVDELSEIFCDILKERYSVEITIKAVICYTHNALLSTIFELKEGYYKKYDIKNPVLYFLQVLDNKSK